MPNECDRTSCYQDGRAGAATSAAVVVPLVLKVLPTQSVVDVGCGEGDWLAAFQKAGIEDIWGLDGDHVDRGRLQIPQPQFQVADLTKQFRLDRVFDLAMSLEVA